MIVRCLIRFALRCLTQNQMITKQVMKRITLTRLATRTTRSLRDLALSVLGASSWFWQVKSIKITCKLPITGWSSAIYLSSWKDPVNPTKAYYGTPSTILTSAVLFDILTEPKAAVLLSAVSNYRLYMPESL